MTDEVAIIVLNWNGWQDTIECLESLYKIDYPNYTVIIVDNGSKNESIEMIRLYSEGKLKVKSDFFEYDKCNKPIKIFEYYKKDVETLFKEDRIENLPSNKKLILIKNDRNSGFPEGNNIGIRYALKFLNPKYILLLNNDTIVEKSFLKEMVNFAAHNSKVGFLGPKAYYYDDPSKIQFTGGGTINLKKGESKAIFSDETDCGQHDKFYKTEWIGGSCLLFKTEVIDKIGLLDPKYFLCWEDTDLCLRGSKVGYYSFYVYKANIWHKGGISTQENHVSLYYGIRNCFYFEKKHASPNQYLLFLIYFFGFKFWISTFVYLLYKRNFLMYRHFLMAVKDGIKS